MAPRSPEPAAPHSGSDPAEPERFLSCLDRLGADEILRLASAVSDRTATPDGEVARHRAVACVHDAVRRHRRRRAAAEGARAAVDLVQNAACRAGVSPRAPEVVVVARAAADAVEALTVPAPADARRELLAGWEPLLDRPIGS